MRFLSQEENTRLNWRTIERHGGNFVSPHNYLREEALAYCVEAVGATVFGAPMYPTVADKAAFYLFTIVNDHIFQDGNKRTGLAAALAYLYANGYELAKTLTTIAVDGVQLPKNGSNHSETLYYFTMEVAAGQVNLDGCRAWFAANIAPAARF